MAPLTKARQHSQVAHLTKEEGKVVLAAQRYPASELRENNFTYFKDLNQRVKAIIWP
jgi:hypothetical protein